MNSLFRIIYFWRGEKRKDPTIGILAIVNDSLPRGEARSEYATIARSC